MGTTTVSCSVTDSHGNEATGSFTVSVTAVAASPAPNPPATSPATTRLGFQLLGPTRARNGAIVGYKLLVTNRGTVGAHNIRARLNLALGQRLYRGKARTSNRRYWKRGRQVTWLIRRLQPGQRQVIVLRTAPACRTSSLKLTARSWADNASAITRSRRTLISN